MLIIYQYHSKSNPQLEKFIHGLYLAIYIEDVIF